MWAWSVKCIDGNGGAGVDPERFGGSVSSHPMHSLSTTDTRTKLAFHNP
jgi:hypothetical protein